MGHNRATRMQRRVRRRKIQLTTLFILFIGAGFLVGILYIRNRADSSPVDPIAEAVYYESPIGPPEPTPVPRPPEPALPEPRFEGDNELRAHAIEDGVKTAYLTFDDGPSKQTTKILDILAEHDIKATFFVLGSLAEKNPDIIRREHEEGHIIANHSYSHIYKTIYANSANFISELTKTEQIITDIIGKENLNKVFRFPGGSFEKYKEPYKKVLNEYGYMYIDWNALNGDGEAKKSNSRPLRDQLYERYEQSSANRTKIVLLMHDAAAKSATVESLPDVIKDLKRRGFEFRTLNYCNQAASR